MTSRPGSRLPRKVTAAGATGVAALAAIAGCGSSSGGKTATAGASSSSGDSKTVNVVITNDGCKPDADSYPAGPLTFKISNKDATGVSELELLSDARIIGEKENLAPGFSGSFSLNLTAGSYTIYCPGAGTDKFPINVTGGAASKAPTDVRTLLQQGTETYAKYVNEQIDLMITNTQPLVAAIRQGDLTAAQQAYGKSRPYYERIEPVAESFTTGSQDLDAAIDARADDVPIDQVTGYHRIEYGLFEKKSTDGLEPLATGLMANLKKLQSLASKLTYQPAELANGAVGLLDEASKSKITGEEERYSHIDLVDLANNVEGSEQAFAALKPGLDEIDAALSSTISGRFDALDTLLDRYRDTNAIGGFVSYPKLTDADTRQIAQAIQAVSEPLSKVADKVVNA